MELEANSPKLTWERLNRREDRKYDLFSVNIERCRSPRTGKEHDFQTLSSPEWVAVIPVTRDRQVVMVRQYRHGSHRLSLEPPGGLVKEGLTPEQAGREELEEETGYQAPHMELLGAMYPVPALFSNRFHVFLAENVEPTGQFNPDETEDVETVLMPEDRVRDAIRSGEIDSGVMIAALHLFLDRLDGAPDGVKS